MDHIISEREHAASGRKRSLSDYLEYHIAKEHICVRLLNYEHNRTIIDTLPHFRKEDLAVVFVYMPFQGKGVHLEELLDQKPDADPAGRYLAQSHEILMRDLEQWEIDVFKLYRDALVASQKVHPMLFASMRQLLRMSGKPEKGEVPLFVLTSKDARYGASVMLYPRVLKEIAKAMQDDLYIIPCSIHELIILKVSDIRDEQSLLQVVQEVNSELLPGEMLSDSLYTYSQKDNDIYRVRGF